MRNAINVLGLLVLSFSLAKSQVAIADLSTGSLLGGSENGKWLTAAQMAPKMKKQMEFKLIGWNGVEEGGVSMAAFRGESEICGDYWSFEFELEMDNGVGIDTTAKWNPAPRNAVKIPNSNAIYKTVVQNFLRSKGILSPTVAIDNVYRIDLDGDGTDEVLISATRYAKGMMDGQTIGDYSFTLLRSVHGGKSVDHLLDGEFFSKRPPEDHWPPNVYAIDAVADLNGDGKMEILVSSSYYEGSSHAVFEYSGGKPVAVKELAAECGL